eukprot:429988-Pyramimonas_sp.AAC.1
MMQVATYTCDECGFEIYQVNALWNERAYCRESLRMPPVLSPLGALRQTCSGPATAPLRTPYRPLNRSGLMALPTARPPADLLWTQSLLLGILGVHNVGN